MKALIVSAVAALALTACSGQGEGVGTGRVEVKEINGVTCFILKSTSNDPIAISCVNPTPTATQTAMP